MWFRLFRRDAEAARDAALGLLPDPDEPVADDEPEPDDEPATDEDTASAVT